MTTVEEMFTSIQQSLEKLQLSIDKHESRIEGLERSRPPSPVVVETPILPREEKPPGLTTLLQRQGIPFKELDEDPVVERPLRAASRRLDAPIPMRTSISSGVTYSFPAPTISVTLKELNVIEG